MPAHGLKLSRDSGKSDQVGADGLLLESPNLFEFLQIFQISGVGPLLLPQIYFLPLLISLVTMYYFLMFSLVSFLILWVLCVCVPPYLIFIIQTHAYRQSMQCRVLKKKKKPSRFGAAFET